MSTWFNVNAIIALFPHGKHWTYPLKYFVLYFKPLCLQLILIGSTKAVKNLKFTYIEIQLQSCPCIFNKNIYFQVPLSLFNCLLVRF